MKFIIFISVALLMSACNDEEKKELQLKEQQEKAAVEAAITIMPKPVKLQEMKTVKGHVD